MEGKRRAICYATAAIRVRHSLLKAMFANARFDYVVEGLICEIEVLLEDKKLTGVSAVDSRISPQLSVQ
jgi:hypothetical protein